MTQSTTSATSLPRPGGRPASPLDPARGIPVLDALGAALASQRPLAYNVNLARIAGCVKAGVFASQLLYWTRVGVNVEERDGWIFKTREQWLIETGLSRHEQETARKRLIELGLLQQHKVGVPPKACFRICARTLGMELAALIKAEPVQWTLFDLRSGAEQVRALLGRNLALYRTFTDLCESIPTAVMLTKALTLQKAVLAAQLDRLARKQGERGESKLYQSPGSAPAVPEAWEHNWFHLSVMQWELETGLSPAQLRLSKQQLCQLDLLEEALQTHPKRKAFIRVNVVQLTQRLQSHLRVSLLKPSEGVTGSGLLSALARGLGNGEQGVPPVPSAATIRTSKPSNAGAASSLSVKQLEHVHGFADSSTGRGRQFLPSVVAGTTRQNLPTVVSGNTRRELPNAEQLPELNSAASFPQTANLPGEVSLGKRPHLPLPTASFRISQRPVLADLHARTGFLTTAFKTTTPTTTPTSSVATDCEKLPQRPEVVVVSQVNAGRESPENLPALDWPDGLPVDARDLCRKVLRPVEPARQQDLVDELAGRMAQGKVKQPVAYLGHLVRLDSAQRDAGGLVLELAHDVRATRQARQVNRQRLAAALAPDTLIQEAKPGDQVDVLVYRKKLSQLSKEFKGKARLFPK